MCAIMGQANMDRRGKSFFTYVYFFVDAEFEEKFLNRKYQQVIEERDCKKTEWCKTTTEFRGERFNLRFLLSLVIMQEKYRKL